MHSRNKTPKLDSLIQFLLTLERIIQRKMTGSIHVGLIIVFLDSYHQDKF